MNGVFCFILSGECWVSPHHDTSTPVLHSSCFVALLQRSHWSSSWCSALQRRSLKTPSVFLFSVTSVVFSPWTPSTLRLSQLFDLSRFSAEHLLFVSFQVKMWWSTWPRWFPNWRLGPRRAEEETPAPSREREGRRARRRRNELVRRISLSIVQSWTESNPEGFLQDPFCSKFSRRAPE